MPATALTVAFGPDGTENIWVAQTDKLVVMNPQREILSQHSGSTYSGFQKIGGRKGVPLVLAARDSTLSVLDVAKVQEIASAECRYLAPPCPQPPHLLLPQPPRQLSPRLGHWRAVRRIGERTSHALGISDRC